MQQAIWGADHFVVQKLLPRIAQRDPCMGKIPRLQHHAIFIAGGRETARGLMVNHDLDRHDAIDTWTGDVHAGGVLVVNMAVGKLLQDRVKEGVHSRQFQSSNSPI